jgi:HD-GYP domain-containing protein (c-di-GMP phosphodiesterase class II)
MRGHARRVSFYSSLLADRLGLSPEQREHVRISAFLHDLGKVGVPTDLLLRPGALDPQERRLVEQHPVIGARLIVPLHIPAAVSAGIRHHHEWWDGTGYPDEIAGEEIPLIARIIGITDAFDAMSCNRPYRRPLARESIVAELERCAAVQFDPELTKEFVAILETGSCDVDPELVADAVADALTLAQPAAGARAEA